jgi:hypothetical protein
MARNPDQALRAQFCRKSPGIIESVKNERGEMHEILVRIIEPCSGGEGEERRLRFNLHANEADGTCTQKSRG